ncbi:hypothetical protein PR202_ga03788 [Eleusine coracana subsp. coracana]|uniref:Uncharacterized protein n=1 Tax=Eleusine coracana subsp. coracana TaxID=191504 RepID=A0AAV5BN77_ELECO|nr:hypothetical protein PR202_ga03788 [Eleusine coracana subsp. coracana]
MRPSAWPPCSAFFVSQQRRRRPAPAGASEDKLEWLRSQLIGKNIEFDTPFGRRMLTYADQTASGRSLRYIEDYLVKDVLPFYGNTHTEDSHVGSKTTRLVHKAARYIKRCMGAGPNDVLIFCGSGTTAAIKRLQERGGGCACAGPYGHTLLKIENDLSLRLRSAILQGYSGLKPGWTRLSFSYYLSKEEFKFILSAIEFIASYGHRFLPLYKFDWITGNWTFKKEAIKYLLMKEELALGTSLDTSLKMFCLRMNAKIEKKHRAIQNKFENYLESAKIIALSLPDIKQPTVSVPQGVDPDLVLFLYIVKIGTPSAPDIAAASVVFNIRSLPAGRLHMP